MSESIVASKSPVAIGLVHHPIRARDGRIVATNITNFDIHDIARACKSYGIDSYYIIHPAKEQQMFVSRVLDHWRTGEGSGLNPMRRTALGPVKLADSWQEALSDWGQDGAEVLATTARDIPGKPRLGFRELRQKIENKEAPKMILFGTGFGLADDVLFNVNGILEPIQGAPPQDYRHLSVRSAVTIVLDRLLGSW